MNVFIQFSVAISRSTDKAALVSGLGPHRLSISYGELNDRVDRAVQILRENGLRPGDKVLLGVPLSIDTYVAMLAILKAGMVIMYIDPAHGSRTVARCLSAHPPRAIIATRGILLLGFLSAALRRIPKRFLVSNSAMPGVNICDGNRASREQLMQRRSLEDSALLTFTSGSTGEPKAVVRTHGFLRNQFAVLEPVAALRTDDIDLVAMPMFVLFNLASGITSVIPAFDMKQPAKANPRLLWKQLKQENVTRMLASPALLERLADYCSRSNNLLPTMRRVSTGGGPVSPTLPGRLQSVAPHARISMVYGSTEAEPIASIDKQSVSLTDVRDMSEGAGLLVGKPVKGCVTRIIQNNVCKVVGPCSHDAFEALQVKQGCVGEIVVSGGHVLSGYADVAHDRETKIDVDGELWHRTGDAGYFDDAGRLWLVGRTNASIQDKRGEIYPFQVEYAVAAVPGVRRAALLADNNKRVLVIEMAGRRNAADCLNIARCIAAKDIDQFVTVARIPMDKRHGAKVDYPALRSLVFGPTSHARLAVSAALMQGYAAACRWIKNAQAMFAHGRN